jgi:hypothetical protein
MLQVGATGIDRQTDRQTSYFPYIRLHEQMQFPKRPNIPNNIHAYCNTQLAGGWPGGSALGLFSGGAWFESRLDHWIS